MNAPEVPLATRARSVGVELRGATRALALALHPCLAQHPLDGGVMDPELGGDGPYPPVLDEVVAQDLRLELVVERHRARCSVPGATPSASSYRRATPLPTDELADRARAEVAVHLRSAARCASSLGGRFGRHRRIGLAHRNSMRGEFSIARGASGTVMRHFVACTRLRGTGAGSASGARHDSAGRAASADTGVPPRATIHAERGRCSAPRSSAGPGHSASR